MPQSAVTIGTFDGVHAGHRALVERCRHAVGPDGTVAVLAFDPHPAAALPGREPPARLTTFDRRARLLTAAGADDVRRLVPDDALLALTPDAFLRHVVDEFRPAAIVEGGDFRFGRGRAGTAEGLRDLGQTLGFEVHILDPVEVVLTDQSLVRASSTTVRRLLAEGRVADAARLLGRPHALDGTVARGDRLGRTIGVPTANVRTEVALPADGVYAARAHLPDGSAHPAAMNVGVRPTVNGVERRCEAHLLGLPTSLGNPSGSARPADWSPLPDLPEYGWPITLEPIAWVRDQVRFPSVDLLRAQLDRDCARVPGLLDAADTIAHLRAPNTHPEEAPA